MIGICGTCAEPAEATAENEGYSYCCNDRIEYGDEAAATVRRANCEHEYERTGERGQSWNGTQWVRDTWVVVRCTKCGDESYDDYEAATS